MGHHGRQVLIAASCDGFGPVSVESESDDVTLVPRSVSIFAGGNGMQCRTDGVERLLAPRPEVMKAPLNTGIRAAGPTRRMGEVGQVRVFQQMDRSKRLLSGVVGKRGDCRGVLVDGIQSRQIGHQASGGQCGRAERASSVSRHAKPRCRPCRHGLRLAVSATMCSTARFVTAGSIVAGHASVRIRVWWSCRRHAALSTVSPRDSRCGARLRSITAGRLTLSTAADFTPAHGDMLVHGIRQAAEQGESRHARRVGGRPRGPSRGSRRRSRRSIGGCRRRSPRNPS